MAKGPKDINQTAFDAVARLTGTSESFEVERAKKGAAARTEALSPERRTEIARAAAAKRWDKPATAS
jgi:hypothetical protein